jgi:hypothetical protein
MPPLGGDAVLHGGDELRQRPVADAMGRVGGDVGRDEGAEVTDQRLTARQDQAILAFRLCARVARCAAPGPEHGLTGGWIARKCGDFVRAHMLRCGKRNERPPRQEPQGDKSDQSAAHDPGTTGG